MATQPSYCYYKKLWQSRRCGKKTLPGNKHLEVSRPVLEQWLKDIKSPKSTLDTAVNTSSEIIKRIPDLPKFMDRADYALKLMAEGKLNQHWIK